MRWVRQRGWWLSGWLGLLVLLLNGAAPNPIQAALAKLQSRDWDEANQGFVELLKCRIDQPVEADAQLTRLMTTFDLNHVDSRTMEVLTNVAMHWGWYWRRAIFETLTAGPILELRYDDARMMRMGEPGQVVVTYGRVKLRYAAGAAARFERVRKLTSAKPDAHGWHVDAMPAHLGGWMAARYLQGYNRDALLAVGTNAEITEALGFGWLGSGNTFNLWVQYDKRRHDWQPLPGVDRVELTMPYGEAKRLCGGLAVYWHLPQPRSPRNVAIWLNGYQRRLLYNPIPLPIGYD